MAKAVADVNGDGEGGFASDGSDVTGFSHMHDSGTGGVRLPFVDLHEVVDVHYSRLHWGTFPSFRNQDAPKMNWTDANFQRRTELQHILTNLLMLIQVTLQ